MRTRLVGLVAASLFFALAMAARAEEPARRDHGPWPLERLKTVPEIHWGKTSGPVREVYYEGEPLNGKPTRVFGYYATPGSGSGPFPAMVLVHGGGGHAFREWATLWAERGYAALAMDLAGQGPDRKRLPDGGPPQDDDTKFRSFSDNEANQMWTYHAVAAVIRGVSVLAAQHDVDAERIGITGISWGGYLTCIVAGLDDRLKVAVPVYGCGFLDENSYWADRLRSMPAEQRTRWIETFDPSRYLSSVHCPTLFVNGTNDFAYPLDSYQKTYSRVSGPVDLCIRVGMPHGHSQGWKPKEIGLFVDSILKGGDPLARFGPLELNGKTATAPITSRVPLAKAQVHFTSDRGPWRERRWTSEDASIADGKASATLPETRPLVLFFTVADERGALTSSRHVETP